MIYTMLFLGSQKREKKEKKHIKKNTGIRGKNHVFLKKKEPTEHDPLGVSGPTSQQSGAPPRSWRFTEEETGRFGRGKLRVLFLGTFVPKMTATFPWTAGVPGKCDKVCKQIMSIVSTQLLATSVAIISHLEHEQANFLTFANRCASLSANASLHELSTATWEKNSGPLGQGNTLFSVEESNCRNGIRSPELSSFDANCWFKYFQSTHPVKPHEEWETNKNGANSNVRTATTALSTNVPLG